MTANASCSDVTFAVNDCFNLCNDLHEELDGSGEAIRVGNLTFVEGILGRGAYGTVRLAVRDRDRPPAHTKTTQITSSRRLGRSISAPAGKDIFRSSYNGRSANSSSSLFRDDDRISASRTRSFDFDDGSEDEDYVAVKIFRKSQLKRMRTMERNKETNKVQVRTALEKVEREIALMKKLSHPNLVKFFEAIDSPDSGLLYMVIEYMPLGEILTYQNNGTFSRRAPPTGIAQIPGITNGHFDERHAALYFVDILHGLAYLHHHHIVHRDLKPENVLLDCRGVARLSDFGVSHMFDEDETFCTTDHSGASISSNHSQTSSASLSVDDLKRKSRKESFSVESESALNMKPMGNTGLMTKTEGTWAFWSPEMYGCSSFSGYAADIWAAGVCLYIFVTGRLPFYSEAPAELMDLIKEGTVPYDDIGITEEMLDLLKKVLEKNPSKRAGVGDCLGHSLLERPRKERIKLLSIELARSEATNTKVSESDIRSAFRIVSKMPAVLLRTASKQLQAGFQAARSNFSFDRPTTPRRRGLSVPGEGGNTDKESDNDKRINRSNSSKASSRKKSFQSFFKSPASPPRTPKQQITQSSSIFRSAASSVSGESAASRIKSFFRIAKHRDSETFSANSGGTPTKSSVPERQNKVSRSVIFHRKQSDISNISGSCDEADGSGQEFPDSKPVSKRRHRSRVPAVIEDSLAVMLDSQAHNNDATYARHLTDA
ncbi:hypothetical protein FisN_1Hh112 [Fistulifera solaris]|uniref:Protein kinase domain-containing protein n=1 Tax=Fistulifera solaris TaxID=1519565 RepID=A0A1Z5JE16_FISSO|nr:hypothetical protein FisN_1Hh112 [Fistulifera solaris]|eukprot:GAX12186.1 hypothetical protein FisN_1Hh112 [Fistulifera solaris]